MLKLYVATTQMLRKYLANDERGVTAIEYGLIAGLVAVVLIGTLGTVGTQLGEIYTAIADALTQAAANIPPPTP